MCILFLSFLLSPFSLCRKQYVSPTASPLSPTASPLNKTGHCSQTGSSPSAYETACISFGRYSQSSERQPLEGAGRHFAYSIMAEITETMRAKRSMRHLTATEKGRSLNSEATKWHKTKWLSFNVFIHLME